MTKILVIEDEAILREEVIVWLTLEGYEAMGAEDGTAGVMSAFRNLPDLIVCDITMPRLDGYGVLLEIHTNPATARIPFIFMTARASHDDIRAGMSFGVDDYLTKPFSRLEFLQAIQSRLEKKAAQERYQQEAVEQLRKALTQEHEAGLLKAKFVAMFSHDFRNQLAVILASNRLLRNYADRLDEQRRLLHMNGIETAARQLLQMLDDMLVVAQMETGGLILKPEPLNLGEVIQDIVEQFQIINGSTYQVVHENHFFSTVIADPRLIHQIASNLISNAIKYSPEGSVVRVVLDDHKGQCVFTVQDQGIGIPEADLPRLFETFQRGSNVNGVAGTGLGLAIVKQAVDLLGGSINVESQVGVGTTMTVTIPTATH
ncbi:MAG: hybrid sensor histidine kinase/response regulator [Aggregatilineales bacterium]